MKNRISPAGKRYIVTLRDANASAGTTASIFGTMVQDAVSVMASDAFANDAEVLHLDGLGVVISTLSDEKAREIQSDDRVLAVEEDAEMFALYEVGPMNGEEYAVASDLASEYFGVGYSQGVLDARRNFAEALQKIFDQDNIALNGLPIPRFPFVPRVPAIPRIPVPSSRRLPVPWNISMVKAPQAWSRGFTGEGVKVAVIDTGITAHTDLVVAGGAGFIPGSTNFQDDNGHGTHCAGVIGARNNLSGVVGVAPNSSLYAVKVLNSLGGGQISWIVAGMAWALQNGMNVVSLSLGAPAIPYVGYTQSLTRLSDAGIHVVCASGNAFQTTFPWVGTPANNHPNIIAVGAVDSSKVIAPFSSRGVNGPGWNGVSIVAPGVSVNSTWPQPANSFKQLSGTSMACPHVSGAVALLCQKFPNLTPQQVKARLMSSASDLGTPGLDATYGAGLLDCDLLTR